MLPHFSLIDLTNYFQKNSPTWDGKLKYSTNVLNDYDNTFRSLQLEFKANIGTHLDAPAHVVPGSSKISDLSLEQLCGPAAIVYGKAHTNSRVSKQDILDYEKSYGTIDQGSWVIFMTGWGSHWNNPEHYRNADTQGNPRFPQIGADAAQLLVDRKVKGIAVDTFSPDNADTQWQVHKTLLGNNVLIVENIKYQEGLPPAGSWLGCFPLFFEDLVESPIRAVLYAKSPYP